MKNISKIFHSTVAHNNPKSNIDMNNSGYRTDVSVPKESISSRSGKIRTNSPIQPVLDPAKFYNDPEVVDKKQYNDTFSRPWNLT